MRYQSVRPCRSRATGRASRRFRMPPSSRGCWEDTLNDNRYHGGGRVLRDADELLLPAVSAAIGALTLEDSDAAVVKLAQAYAAAIDTDAEGDELEKLGPKLLAALTALQATPA